MQQQTPSEVGAPWNKITSLGTNMKQIVSGPEGNPHGTFTGIRPRGQPTRHIYMYQPARATHTAHLHVSAPEGNPHGTFTGIRPRGQPTRRIYMFLSGPEGNPHGAFTGIRPQGQPTRHIYMYQAPGPEGNTHGAFTGIRPQGNPHGTFTSHTALLQVRRLLKQCCVGDTYVKKTKVKCITYITIFYLQNL